MCRAGMSLKDKTYKSIRNQNKIRLEGDVNSCSTGSSFKQEPIGQWQLQGLKWELAGQRLSRPLRASNFHPLTLCMCYTCQHSCSLNKYSSANNLQTHTKFWVWSWMLAPLFFKKCSNPLWDIDVNVNTIRKNKKKGWPAQKEKHLQQIH